MSNDASVASGASGSSTSSRSSETESSLGSDASEAALEPPRFTFGPVPSTQSFAADHGRPWLASVHAGESLLVLGTHAGSVYVLDPTGHGPSLVRALKPHSASVQAVVTDSAEQYVASVGLDGIVSVSALGTQRHNTVPQNPPLQSSSSTKKKPSPSGLSFSLPFAPFVSSSSGTAPTGSDLTAQNETWTYADGRPLRAIALDPLFYRRANRAFVTGGNAGTVVLRELPPSTSSGVPGMGQLSLPWLRRSGPGEHVATTLHASDSDGPIWALTWRTHLIAWACERGVRIYDLAARTKVAFIAPPGPDVQPALSPPHFAWRDKRHLAIGWDTTIKVVRIRPRQSRPTPPGPVSPAARGRTRAGSTASNITTAPSTSPSPPASPALDDRSDPPSRRQSMTQSTPPPATNESPQRRAQRSSPHTGPRLAADVVQILHLDAQVAGVVPCGHDLLVLAHVEEKDDPDQSCVTTSSSTSSPIRPRSSTQSSRQSSSARVESPLELRLISPSGEELNAEPVPLPPHPPGRRRGVSADYALACPSGSCADLDVAAVTAALAQAEAILAAAIPEEPRTATSFMRSPGAGEQDADDEDKPDPTATAACPSSVSGSNMAFGGDTHAPARASTPPTPLRPSSLPAGQTSASLAPVPHADLPAGTDATFYILTPFGLTASHPASWQNRVDYLLSLNAYEAALGQLEALGRKYAAALGYRWAEIGMLYLYQLVRSDTGALTADEEDDPPGRHRYSHVNGPARAAAQAPTILARDKATWEAFVLGLRERAGKWAVRHRHVDAGALQPAVRVLAAGPAGHYLSYHPSKDCPPEGAQTNPYTTALTALAAHLPTTDPELDQHVYDIMLAHLIVVSPSALRPAIEAWSPSLYHVDPVVEALHEQRALLQASSSNGRLEERVDREATDWDHLTFALARVYMRTGRPGTALPLLLSVRWPGVFRLIAEHGLFSAVQDLAAELVLFDRDVHQPPSRFSKKSEPIVANDVSNATQADVKWQGQDISEDIGKQTLSGATTSDSKCCFMTGQSLHFGASVDLLVQHALSITPARVVPQLENLGLRFETGQAPTSPEEDVASEERDGLYLYLYLSSLFRAVLAQPVASASDDEAAALSPALIAPYANKLVILAARFDRDILMVVLRSLAEEYDIQKAYQVCLSRDYVPEMVFLLGRVGDTKRALDLILTRLGDVRRALTFVQEHNDPDLWEDLFKYAETRPAFITAILTYGGDGLDAARFITRLADGLVIPGLRDALVRLLTAKRRQLELLSGCADVLTMEAGAQAAARQHTISAAMAGALSPRRSCDVCNRPLFAPPSQSPTTGSAHNLSASDHPHTGAYISGSSGLLAPVSGQRTDPAIVFLCQHVAHLQCCIGGPARLKARLPQLIAASVKDAPIPDNLDRIERPSSRVSLGLVTHSSAKPWIKASVAEIISETGKDKSDHERPPPPPWSQLRFPRPLNLPRPAHDPEDQHRLLHDQDSRHQRALTAALEHLELPLRPSCPLCRSPRTRR